MTAPLGNMMTELGFTDDYSENDRIYIIHDIIFITVNKKIYKIILEDDFKVRLELSELQPN